MATEYQPGDRVRVVIEDAKVIQVLGGGQRIFLESSEILGGSFGMDSTATSVTITRLTPTPQAGEVWEHPKHGAMFIHTRENLVGGDSRPWARTASGSSWPIDKIDFSGGRRVYPPATEVTP